MFSIFLAMGIPATGAAGFWVASTAVVTDKIIGIMLFSSGEPPNYDICPVDPHTACSWGTYLAIRC